MRSIFTGAKKCGGAIHHKGGVAPTGVLRSLAAVRRRTVTDLLCVVTPYIITIYFILFI